MVNPNFHAKKVIGMITLIIVNTSKYPLSCTEFRIKNEGKKAYLSNTKLGVGEIYFEICNSIRSSDPFF